MEIATSVNADSVAAGSDQRHDHADDDLQTHRSAMLAGMAQATRQQSVSAHGEHHACQAEQQHHDHGGHADDDAEADDLRSPVGADHLERDGQ